MLQIAIIEDEADLAQQTKDNVVRYLNEHGLEGNIAVFNDGMDIAENYKPIWDILLLDIEMPLLERYECCSENQRTRCDCRYDFYYQNGKVCH